MGVRNTRGTDTCSLYIQRSLAAVLTNESTASVLKSTNMIPPPGRRPRSAMPAARPVIPASETGVANTRSGKAEDKPRVTLKAPPYGSRMSSPSSTTGGSSLKARCRLLVSASSTAVNWHLRRAGQPGLAQRQPAPTRRLQHPPHSLILAGCVYCTVPTDRGCGAARPPALRGGYHPISNAGQNGRYSGSVPGVVVPGEWRRSTAAQLKKFQLHPRYPAHTRGCRKPPNVPPGCQTLPDWWEWSGRYGCFRSQSAAVPAIGWRKCSPPRHFLLPQPPPPPA